MKSLNKKAGGWSKLNSIASLERHLGEKLLIYKPLYEMLIETLPVEEIDKKVKALNTELETGYSLACKFKSNPHLVPIPVCKACAVNALTCNGKPLEKKLEDFNLWQTMNNSGVELHMTHLISHPTRYFYFESTPEGKLFWENLDKLMEEYWTEGWKDFFSMRTYKEFIDAHPECEEEIMKFCKNGGN